MKVLFLLFSLAAVVLSQAPLAELTDQMHFERLFEPYTYQRINYDLGRFAYNARYPNNNNRDGWTPASWTDIFGPRKGK